MPLPNLESCFALPLFFAPHSLEIRVMGLVHRPRVRAQICGVLQLCSCVTFANRSSLSFLGSISVVVGQSFYLDCTESVCLWCRGENQKESLAGGPRESFVRFLTAFSSAEIVVALAVWKKEKAQAAPTAPPPPAAPFLFSSPRGHSLYCTT